MKKTLRPYQLEQKQEVRDHMMKGIRKILVEAPTGSGKTILAADLIESAQARGKTVCFNMHRRELIKQSAKTFVDFNIDFGIISGGFPEELHRPVQIASVPTMVRRLDRLPKFDLMIWDEAHHIVAGSWDKVFQHYPDSFHVLLTATPERLDGKGLKDYADKMVKGKSVRWLIDNGFLSDYEAYAPNQVSMAGVKMKFGEFDKKDIKELVDKPTITGSSISEYQKLCPGKRAIVFCITVEHSEHVVAQFKAAGIAAAHIDGNTASAQRDFLLKQFRDGEIKVLSNVGLFGEGFDLESLDCLIMLRPTASRGLFRQMCGRPLRFFKGKTAIIIDHVGNIARHGLPCMEIDWTLEGKVRKRGANKDTGAPVKTCTQCLMSQYSRNVVCQSCGLKFPAIEREISEVDGELVKINKKKMQMKRKTERGNARTLEDLQKIGIERGYKPGWALNVYKSRRNH